MIKILGVNYLHPHPHTEKILGVDANHVIVDKRAWEEVVDYFRRFPVDVEHLGKSSLPDLYNVFKDTDIDVVGNCANCGVEFHIHKP